MRHEQLWENIFTPYRRRIMYPMAGIGAFVLLPLAIYDTLQGKAGIGAILFFLVAMMLVDAIALHLRKQPPIPFAFLLVPGFAGVAMSLATQGIYGAFWSFPLLLLGFFVLSQSAANAVGIALIAIGTVLTGASSDVPTALRYLFALSLCLFVINVLLNVLMSMHARLVEQSITDALTGAFNRRQMDVSLAEAVERQRRAQSPSSALLIDIDHFKRINDRLGHAAGDEALQGVVSVVRSRCRKLDMLFRQGGEEFLLLLPETRLGEAMVVAENLRYAIEHAPLLREKVTVSIGASELRPDDNVKSWMKRVDQALYAAKKSGRNRVVAADLRSVPSGIPEKLRRFFT